jgi:RNA polymerase sigma factor (sigma-70 family)
MVSDQNVWKAFKNGDKDAMKNIYEDNVNMLYSYGKRIINDDLIIYDHIHDIFVKLWEQREKINEPTSIKGYLVTMLRNHIIDGFRKNKIVNIDQTDKVFDANEDSIESTIIFRDDETKKSNQLVLAMQKLTSNQKEIIFLKYQKELSYEEIGEILNINYQSVRNLAHRAITELRKHMTLVSLIHLLSTILIK